MTRTVSSDLLRLSVLVGLESRNLGVASGATGLEHSIQQSVCTNDAND